MPPDFEPATASTGKECMIGFDDSNSVSESDSEPDAVDIDRGWPYVLEMGI